MTDKKIFAGYIRCSTTKQDLESQRFNLNAWAEKQGHNIILFEDFAQSGRKTDREAITELMQRCRKKEFDGVAVVEISRFGRSVKMIYELIEELTKLGLKIILANTNTTLDYNSLEGRALIGGLALASDIEWMLISERNRRGREKIKRNNIKVGRKRAEEKDISLKAVLSLKEQGLGYRGIAKELNTSIATISRMLKRYEDGHLRNVTQSNQNTNETGQKIRGVTLN